MLTGIKDVDREILSKVDDKELLKVCSVDKRFWNDVCDDDFLRRRFLNKYPGIERYKETWKEFFLKMTFYISSMKEEFDFVYTTGNPKQQYKLFKDNPINHRFLAADSAKKGELPILVYAINKGNLTARRNYYLSVAAENGHLNIVKYLVEQGIDFQEEDALVYAVRNGHLDIVKYLVEKGSDIHINNEEPLREASKRGYLNIVKYLVERGADIHVNDDEPLRKARQNGHVDVVQYLESL